jgi:7-carboxy-7-deazaguanine synthase
MKVAEIFHSIQGEGIYTGVPTVFIRLSGCHLCCSWCDTPYASHRPEGEKLSVAEIVEAVEEHRYDHVVITGGEPFLFSELGDLARALKSIGCFITIESSGTIWGGVDCDLMSLSPKLSNSIPEDAALAAKHEQLRLNVEALSRFLESYDCQLKFVIEKPGDIAEVDDLLGELPYIRADRVLLMPQAEHLEELKDKSSWIVAECLKKGWRFCDRLHVRLWDGRRGT